jgi:hypothetical protein
LIGLPSSPLRPSTTGLGLEQDMTGFRRKYNLCRTSPITERVFCFNQMCYILFVEGFERGHIPGAPKLTLEEIYRLQAHSSYLLESNNIRYTKQIFSSEPFKGKIERVNTFIRKGILFLDIAYNFKDGRATGESRVCILLKHVEDYGRDRA